MNKNQKSLNMDLLNLHNSARQAAGVKPLVLSNTAATAAQNCANENAAMGRLKHQPLGPLLTGKVRTAGENIAYGQNSPQEVMESWVSSRAHRRNILNPAYKSAGFGMAKGKRYIFWCAVFLG